MLVGGRRRLPPRGIGIVGQPGCGFIPLLFKIDGGALPDFLAETKEIREGSWSIAGIPSDLQDRRTEITGPVDRKMIIMLKTLGKNLNCLSQNIERR